MQTTIAEESQTLTQPDIQPICNKWASVTADNVDGYITQYHIMPVDDMKPHTLHHDCWCKPFEDPWTNDMWIHKALDNREWYFERPFQ
jgi:hypothetical protein